VLSKALDKPQGYQFLFQAVGHLQFAFYLIKCGFGDANSSGFSQTFQSSSDIDAITVNSILFLMGVMYPIKKKERPRQTVRPL
jgi:hypothetical protein